MDAVARVRKAVRRDLSIEPADSLASVAVSSTTGSVFSITEAPCGHSGPWVLSDAGRIALQLASPTGRLHRPADPEIRDNRRSGHQIARVLARSILSSLVSYGGPITPQKLGRWSCHERASALGHP